MNPQDQETVDKILGTRRDLDLDQYWWHRLFKVAFILGLAGFALFIVMSVAEGDGSYYPEVRNVTRTSLGSVLGRADASVPNVMPEFLKLSGKLGVIDKDSNRISDIAEYTIDESWCTPDAVRHAEATASFLSRRDGVKKTKEDILKAVEDDLKKNPNNRGFCWMESESGRGLNNIVKYQFRTVYYWMNQLGPVALFIGVVGLVLINVYNRGILYVIFGSP